MISTTLTVNVYVDLLATLGQEIVTPQINLQLNLDEIWSWYCYARLSVGFYPE